MKHAVLTVIVFLSTVLAALILNPHHASAGARFTGAYLLHICQVTSDGKAAISGGHTACQAYIAGIIDYHNLQTMVGLAPDMPLCIPEDLPLNVLHEDVLAYLEKNKHHDDFVASPAVITALYQKYPCKKKK